MLTHRKIKKQAIMKSGPAIKIQDLHLQNGKPDCLTAILSQAYSEIDNEKINQLTILCKEYVNYQTTPQISILLHLLALSCVQGSPTVKNRQYEKYKDKPMPERSFLYKKIEEKKFKTILVNDQDFFKIGNKLTGGFYSCQHSIFLNTVKPIASAFLHESAHYAAYTVMEGNYCNPYKINDFTTKTEYQKIVDRIQTVSSFWIPATPDGCISKVLAVFQQYSEEEYHRELFVIITDVIGYYGYQTALEWLNSTLPDLLNFYETKFMPICMEYLIENKIEEYITCDPFFLLQLNQYKPKMENHIPLYNSLCSKISNLAFFPWEMNIKNEIIAMIDELSDIRALLPEKNQTLIEFIQSYKWLSKTRGGNTKAYDDLEQHVKYLLSDTESLDRNKFILLEKKKNDEIKLIKGQEENNNLQPLRNDKNTISIELQGVKQQNVQGNKSKRNLSSYRIKNKVDNQPAIDSLSQYSREKKTEIVSVSKDNNFHHHMRMPNRITQHRIIKNQKSLEEKELPANPPEKMYIKQNFSLMLLGSSKPKMADSHEDDKLPQEYKNNFLI